MIADILLLPACLRIGLAALQICRNWPIFWIGEHMYLSPIAKPDNTVIIRTTNSPVGLGIALNSANPE